MPRSRLPLLALVSLLSACNREIVFTETPPCSNPAPLEGQKDPSNSRYMVGYHPGTPVQTTTDRLAQKHGFTPTFIYESLPGFSATLSSRVMADVRCAPEVRYVEYDAGTVTRI